MRWHRCQGTSNREGVNSLHAPRVAWLASCWAYILEGVVDGADHVIEGTPFFSPGLGGRCLGRRLLPRMPWSSHDICTRITAPARAQPTSGVPPAASQGGPGAL